jgi:hypothetical protein
MGLGATAFCIEGENNGGLGWREDGDWAIGAPDTEVPTVPGVGGVSVCEGVENIGTGGRVT